jgi:signal transduction histidine kinase
MKLLPTLRSRIYFTLTTLVMITLVGGVVMIYYTQKMENILSAIIDHHLTSYKAAEALETALVNQKGFVSYYFLDGNPDWLRQLGEYRQIFKERLNEARLLANTQEEEDAIEQIATEYQHYIENKDRVIAYYKDRQAQSGAVLHEQVRDRFFKLLDNCEAYKDLQKQRIFNAQKQSRRQAEQYRAMAVAAMVLDLTFGLSLALLLMQKVIRPICDLLLTANQESDVHRIHNIVEALDDSVRGLIRDAGQTHIELERSREHLLQAEKMVIVGKLSAGMAHSIRNPLTSVKMRLFSLSRSLDLSETQQEDFEVISDEIRHIDTIVQNFLEFSRPPKLKMQQISPSTVIDGAIQLLQHRLKSYDVSVDIRRKQLLPQITADPEQLKEVIVNLVVNACEAMHKGGKIDIAETIDDSDPSRAVAVITLQDNGPGISETFQTKIFQPFFTTKEEGTGLGLSIAERIVKEHHGWITVTSAEGEGTAFMIHLPVKKGESS